MKAIELMNRHRVPILFLGQAVHRFNLGFTPVVPITAYTELSPMQFARVAYLLPPRGYEALPRDLRDTLSRLLSTLPQLSGAGTPKRPPETEQQLRSPHLYVGRQNSLRYLDGAEGYVELYRDETDLRVQQAVGEYLALLPDIEQEMLAREWDRVIGTAPDLTALRVLGGRLVDAYHTILQRIGVVEEERAQALYQKYKLDRKIARDSSSTTTIAVTDSEETGLPRGCTDMSENCPVRGLPAKLYRWQSFSPKNGINVPNDDKGIPTAVNGKVAYAMGAISTDYLVEIDREALLTALGEDVVEKGFYAIVGSRTAGWEFKIWVNVPQAAISKVWGKGAVPSGHKPRSL